MAPWNVIKVLYLLCRFLPIATWPIIITVVTGLDEDCSSWINSQSTICLLLVLHYTCFLKAYSWHPSDTANFTPMLVQSSQKIHVICLLLTLTLSIKVFYYYVLGFSAGRRSCWRGCFVSWYLGILQRWYGEPQLTQWCTRDENLTKNALMSCQLRGT